MTVGDADRQIHRDADEAVEARKLMRFWDSQAMGTRPIVADIPTFYRFGTV